MQTPPPPPLPMLGRCENQLNNTDCSGETWVAGKAERISPTVAASLEEPMLGCNIGWTRRGAPFWKVNRSDGTMVPSWRYPDLLPWVAITLDCGAKCSLGCTSLPPKPFIARQSLRIAKATSMLQGGREGKTYNSLSWIIAHNWDRVRRQWDNKLKLEELGGV